MPDELLPRRARFLAGDLLLVTVLGILGGFKSLRASGAIWEPPPRRANRGFEGQTTADSIGLLLH